MYTLTHSQRGADTPTSTQRAYAPLQNNKRNIRVAVTFSATVQISVAAVTSINNRGSVLALFPQIGIDEAGTEKWSGDARMFGFVSEILSPSARSTTRLTSTAVGTTNLKETIILSFEHPWSANPRETQFLERNIQAVLRAFFKYDPTVTRLVVLGGATVAITNPAVKVVQLYDEGESHLPSFKPEVSEMIVPVAGTLTNYEIPLAQGEWIRALTILQETTTIGEVTDILSALALRGDRMTYIGPDGLVNWDDLVRAQEFEYGGAAFSATSGSYLHLNFQQQGRLSKVLSPRQDTNLRLAINAAVSASAGTSQIRILIHKLVRDPFVGTDGRRVVSEALDFPV